MKKVMVRRLTLVFSTPEDGGLDPIAGRVRSMGHVDEANNAGAEEPPTLALSRDELLQLVRYWADLALTVDVVYFYYEQHDTKAADQAHQKIAIAATILGRRAVRGVWTEVEDERRRLMGDRLWHIFTNGTKEEIEAVREEAEGWRRSNDQLSKAHDATLEERLERNDYGIQEMAGGRVLPSWPRPRGGGL